MVQVGVPPRRNRSGFRRSILRPCVRLVRQTLRTLMRANRFTFTFVVRRAVFMNGLICCSDVDILSSSLTYVLQEMLSRDNILYSVIE